MTTLKHQNIKYSIASPCDQDWASMSGDLKAEVLETVGPEEDWDYKEKEVETQEQIEPLHLMGAMIQVEQD